MMMPIHQLEHPFADDAPSLLESMRPGDALDQQVFLDWRLTSQRVGNQFAKDRIIMIFIKLVGVDLVREPGKICDSINTGDRQAR